MRAAVLDDAREELMKSAPSAAVAALRSSPLRWRSGSSEPKSSWVRREHRLFVVALDAEERREHAQRMALRDHLDEIAFALAPELVDLLPRALGHDVVEAPDAARREEGARDLAEVAVLGRIHLDDRPHVAERSDSAMPTGLLLAAHEHRPFELLKSRGLLETSRCRRAR